MKIQFEFETAQMAVDAADELNENSEMRDCLVAYLCAMLCVKKKKIFNASVSPIYNGRDNPNDPVEYIPPTYAELG